MRSICLPVLLLYACMVCAQKQPQYKFGKIDAADLEKRFYEVDSSADAVVIASIGSSRVKGNNKGWFSLEFKVFKRIHILHKSGYEYATVTIPLYTNGEDEEILDDLKASTYNYENGKQVEAKLDKTGIFKERKNKNLVIQKFTLPNVKEGSVIEYEFKITSDFLFNLQPWTFQSRIPNLWSEYRVTLPQFFNYRLIGKGSHPFFARDQKDKFENFSVEEQVERGLVKNSERINISCGVTEFRWAMKDVPSLKEEAYTSTLDNHIAKLEFQLAGYRAPLTEQNVMNTWPELTQKMMQREDFGMVYKTDNKWLLDEILQPLLIRDAVSETERAKKIYVYLRDNFTCTDHNQLYTDQSLKNILKSRSGGVAEINLLLVALFRQSGINADPVILSTRDNGFVYPNYPVIGQFNYVIAKATVDGRELFLDASHPYLGFAKLNYDCYNGQARLINELASELSFQPSHLTENETTVINIVNDEKTGWTANLKKLYGYYESYKIREQVKNHGKEAFFNDLAKKYDTEIKLRETSIDSLLMYEEPVAVKYNFVLPNQSEDILYVNPMFSEGFRQNPFKSTNRLYPVEIPYKISDSYTLNMKIPVGYAVDEMPQSLSITLGGREDGVFEYKVTQSGDKISLQFHLDVNKTVFQPSEYDGLRDFFAKVVAKQNENIIFKKKK